MYLSTRNSSCDQYFFMKLVPLDSAYIELLIHAKSLGCSNGEASSKMQHTLLLYLFMDFILSLAMVHSFQTICRG